MSNLTVELGVSPEDLQKLQTRNHAEATEALNLLKLNARKYYRKKAAECHPDRPSGGDVARFIELGKALKDIEALQVPLPLVFCWDIPFVEIDYDNDPFWKRVSKGL